MQYSDGSRLGANLQVPELTIQQPGIDDPARNGYPPWPTIGFGVSRPAPVREADSPDQEQWADPLASRWVSARDYLPTRAPRR
jgi:hypothetical protein